MTREEEIRARLEKATSGEWKAEGRHDYSITASSRGGRLQTVIPFHKGDAEFIANAPSDIDYLLKENQRLRDELQHIKHATTLDAARKWASQALDGESHE